MALARRCAACAVVVVMAKKVACILLLATFSRHLVAFDTKSTAAIAARVHAAFA
jgi:hypothetical protein